MNYFKLFNIPQSFKINQKSLSKNFYKLQSQYHPDLFIRDSKLKKKIALEKSIEINKGYRTLKDFLTRAIYLLSLNGFKINKESILLQNNTILVNHFSLCEELDCLKKKQFNESNINDFLKKIEKKISESEKNVEVEFNKKNYKKVIKIIGELLFLKKLKINLHK